MKREKIVIGMYVGNHPELFLGRPRSSYVVNMAVGDQQGHRRQIVTCAQFGNSLRVGRGVHNHARTTRLRRRHVAVGLRKPQGNAIDQHRISVRREGRIKA